MFYFISHGARAEATFATTSTTTEQQELSDAELAQRIHEQELELLTVSEKDRLMAESIAKACESDWQTIQAEREEPIDPSTLLEDEIIEKLAAIYIREPTAPASAAETSENQDGSIEHSIASSPDAQQFWRQCIACLVDFPYHGTARTPCGHDYCRDCIRELFQAALSDDTLFPPRCCQTAMFSLGVRLYLPQGLVEGYHEKKIEMDTVDRTYCSDPTCSAFIKSDTIKDNKAVCRKCQKETCARCKAAGHQNECPLDPSLQSILAAAAAEGWQRCRACGRMIELRTGCNHIT